MTRTFFIIFALLCVSAQLSGCGQTGNLYLPDHQPAGSTSS